MAMTKEALTGLPVFDTRKYVRTLTHEGSFTEKQANANADGLQEALRGVSTKADIKEVKAETHAVKAELKADIRGVRAEIREVKAELKADIRGVKAEVRAEIKEVKAEIKEVRAEIGALRKETTAEIAALRKETTAENQAMQEQIKGLRQLMMIGFSIMATMIATLMAIMVGVATLLLGAAT